MADDDADGPPRDIWDIVKTLGTVLSITAIPLVIAYLGNSLNETLREEESRIALIELAVGVLGEDPKETDPGLRRWAADVLGMTSERVVKIPLPQSVRDGLVTRSRVPQFHPRLDGTIRRP